MITKSNTKSNIWSNLYWILCRHTHIQNVNPILSINSMIIYQFYNLNYTAKKHIKLFLNVFFVIIKRFNFVHLLTETTMFVTINAARSSQNTTYQLLLIFVFLQPKILQFVRLFVWRISFLVKVLA